jgi:uncharacterized protein YndB with AHSA1/START domain
MAKQIEVTRIFDAPVEMVWQLWTEPELVKRWWGPKHFTSPVANIDFREGGKSIVSMQAPPAMGNQVYYSVWRYVKIVPHQSIEFIQSLCDAMGNAIHPTQVGMPPDFPANIQTIVTFRIAEGNGTAMTITEYADFGTISNFAQIGLEQSMDKMLDIFNKS